MPAPPPPEQDDEALTLTIGHEEMIIRRRYEVLSILNDICIGVWFLVGSVMFLYSDWVTFGTWLFIVGSAQLLIRPVIRLAHHIHLKRFPASSFNM